MFLFENEQFYFLVSIFFLLFRLANFCHLKGRLLLFMEHHLDPVGRPLLEALQHCLVMLGDLLQLEILLVSLALYAEFVYCLCLLAFLARIHL